MGGPVQKGQQFVELPENNNPSVAGAYRRIV